MIFGPNKTKIHLNMDVNINREKIEIVQHTNFLGIILDNQLNWKKHIAHLTQKISKSIGILSRARQRLSPDILCQLYYSFLYPYLSYCNVIWGQPPASTLWPIFRIQQRAIRIICNIRRYDSTLLSFKKLQILRLPDIHSLSVLIFMFKFKKGLLPPTFNHFYSVNQQFHRYPTRGAKLLRTPLVRTRMDNMFIRKTGVSLWNKFYPEQLPTNITLRIFKRDLIIRLLSDYLII